METVTISKAEYQSLVRDSSVLNALEAMGVDNWQGYGDAMAYLEEEEFNKENDEYYDEIDEEEGREDED